MRITIEYATTYRYDAPSSGIIQALRVKPRKSHAQHIDSWRVVTDVGGAIRESRDAFGNVVQMFYADAPSSTLTLRVQGRVTTTETAGVQSGLAEPLPAPVFLRRTRLTEPDAELIDLAYAASRGSTLDTLHGLMGAIRSVMRFDPGLTDAATTATEALARRHGVCQDYAHIFIAAARQLGIPARYVSGHLARSDQPRQEAAHAWAEALVPDLGWVAFDPTNGISADERYVRVATGLDYLDAAPVRGARRGGGRERLEVSVHAVDSAQTQTQSQG
ncbi:transglutaminase-like putative cysteine protease [Sphingomonas jejuensis]|uniref:Transglutaminase-like putative cysteine protease n=1 Tax=Sphingomonas jejuensis TaxID=904715 RepID=A0ABX0XKX6_9SPHN|nr:transglutaminase family protein [Sphingomonas jejuensis]NJC34004.1 transglutaminase-like putative cysteine protease [Sphingomonas jejuensis]